MSAYDFYGDPSPWEHEGCPPDVCDECGGSGRRMNLDDPWHPLPCASCEGTGYPPEDVCHWCERPLDIYAATEVGGDYMHPRCAKECAAEEARCEREAVTGVRGAA